MFLLLCLIADVRISYKGEMRSLFFQLVKLQLCTKAAVCDILQLESLAMKGFSKKITSTISCLCNDGTAAV